MLQMNVKSKRRKIYFLEICLKWIQENGDFEAEALCLSGVWEDCGEELQDDLLITVPTKDMVLFTRADDKKSIQRMIKQAQEIYECNQQESPLLIFSRDVFYYDRNTKQLAISKKYRV